MDLFGVNSRRSRVLLAVDTETFFRWHYNPNELRLGMEFILPASESSVMFYPLWGHLLVVGSSPRLAFDFSTRWSSVCINSTNSLIVRRFTQVRCLLQSVNEMWPCCSRQGGKILDSHHHACDHNRESNELLSPPNQKQSGMCRTDASASIRLHSSGQPSSEADMFANVILASEKLEHYY